MKINNREFREWTADDLQVLLNNDAYRENNFVDYKVNFAPLVDKCNKREKQAEFRNDVCSFANADGGYIFYGIGETSGRSFQNRRIFRQSIIITKVDSQPVIIIIITVTIPELHRIRLVTIGFPFTVPIFLQPR